MRRATKVFIALAAVVALVGSAVFWLWWILRGVAAAARTPRTPPRTTAAPRTTSRSPTTMAPRTLSPTTMAPKTVSPTTVAPTATAPRTPSPATTVVTSPPVPVPAAAAEDDAYAPAPVPTGNVPLMTSAPTVSGAPEPGAWEAASFGTDF